MNGKKSPPAPSASRLPLDAGDVPLFLIRRLVRFGRGNFDETLARALLGSLSLSFQEKLRVLETKLSSSQRNNLLEIFTEEEEKFALLYQDHPMEILEFITRQVFTAFMLGRYLGLEMNAALEDAHAHRLVRRAIRRGVCSHLQEIPPGVWESQRLFSWLWRHAMPADHPGCGQDERMPTAI
ncbi:MAG: hypothetical protein KJ558_08045 [Gammaproteobacteria bacterium]|nr:hypothetical protein [Gammaproteobacteria bacterium]MBU1654764.1 hypothetical protein [Gammaproteobacteria bacterium]MBU1962076.1 hypothetical protein [Gammaproteobacteria bacterium]